MSADELFKIGKSTNPLLAGARGMVGGRFVLRQLNGITVISRRPKKPTSQTETQRRNRQRFRQATEFAKKELMSPDRKAHYNQIAARVGLPNAYTAAVRDFMRNEIVIQKTEPKLSTITRLEPRRSRTCRLIRPDRNPARKKSERDHRRLLTIFRSPKGYAFAPASPKQNNLETGKSPRYFPVSYPSRVLLKYPERLNVQA